MNQDDQQPDSPIPNTQQIQEDLSMVKQALHSSDDDYRIHRMTIAWGNVATASLLLMVTPIFLIVVFIVAASGEAAINETAIVGVTMLIPVLFLIFCALPFIIAAYGLFKGNSWGPGAAIVAAVLNLLNIPLGTVLSIYTFVIAGQGKLRAPSIQSVNSSFFIKPSSFMYVIGGILLLGFVGLTSLTFIAKRSELVNFNVSFNGSGFNFEDKSSIKGSGLVITEDRAIEDFRKLNLSIPATVYFSKGEPSLTIEIDDNLLPHITVDQQGYSLKIGTKKNFSTKKGITIRLQSEDIDSVAAYGAANFSLNDINTKNLAIETHGAAKVSGKGACEQLTIKCYGVSSIRLFDFQSQRCKLSFNGASSGNVFASESLEATINGAGSVRYRGNPKDVTKQVNGLGKINKG